LLPSEGRAKVEIEHRPTGISHPTAQMKEQAQSIFEERYRVVSVEGDRLLVRGIVSGQELTIINPEPEVPLRKEDYPPGKLIALSDPSTAPLN
jgi:hypothetical protein